MTQHRWIYLADSPANGVWIDTIRQTAADHALPFVENPVPTDGLPGAIYLTHDIELFLSADASEKVALATPYVPVSGAHQTSVTPSFINNFSASSADYARLSTLPESVRVLWPRELMAGRVLLFADVAINTPPQTPIGIDQRLADMVQAMSLLSDGPVMPGAKTHWSPPIFNYDERAIERQSVPGRMDLTGRPRTLVYGPYIVLPRGLWRATLRFSVDRAASTRRFRFDWGGQTEYAEHLLSPGAPGIYELQMEYFWSEPAPAEARILVMEGVFEGAMDFLGIDIELIGRDPPPSE